VERASRDATRQTQDRAHRSADRRRVPEDRTAEVGRGVTDAGVSPALTSDCSSSQLVTSSVGSPVAVHVAR